MAEEKKRWRKVKKKSEFQSFAHWFTRGNVGRKSQESLGHPLSTHIFKIIGKEGDDCLLKYYCVSASDINILFFIF